MCVNIFDRLSNLTDLPHWKNVVQSEYVLKNKSSETNYDTLSQHVRAYVEKEMDEDEFLRESIPEKYLLSTIEARSLRQSVARQEFEKRMR